MVLYHHYVISEKTPEKDTYYMDNRLHPPYRRYDFSLFTCNSWLKITLYYLQKHTFHYQHFAPGVYIEKVKRGSFTLHGGRLALLLRAGSTYAVY